MIHLGTWLKKITYDLETCGRILPEIKYHIGQNNTLLVT